MQNRYVGAIGDYVKLGILRALSPGYRLGVTWWLYPDENHNSDGRHTGYLNHPERWRQLDPDLFDALSKIVVSGRRHVGAPEAADILSGAIFASEMIPSRGPLDQRRPPVRNGREQSLKPTWLELSTKTVDGPVDNAVQHPKFHSCLSAFPDIA